MTAELTVEWSSPDPQLAALLQSVAALPERSPERLAAEAALHTWHAQHLHKQIGHVLAEQATAERNRRARRPTTPTAAP
jgi:hypothetical protein